MPHVAEALESHKAEDGEGPKVPAWYVLKLESLTGFHSRSEKQAVARGEGWRADVLRCLDRLQTPRSDQR